MPEWVMGGLKMRFGKQKSNLYGDEYYNHYFNNIMLQLETSIQGLAALI